MQVKYFERQKERKRKIANLAYLAEHRISIFYRGNLILNILVLRFEEFCSSCAITRIVFCENSSKNL